MLLRCSRRVLLLLCVCYADCLQLDGEALDPPRPLPWYPDNLAWHLSFSRNQLRKLSWLSDIHEFMKSANEHGSITRQEAVSMVPPLLLDVQPHHKVRQSRIRLRLLVSVDLLDSCGRRRHMAELVWQW